MGARGARARPSLLKKKCAPPTHRSKVHGYGYAGYALLKIFFCTRNGYMYQYCRAVHIHASTSNFILVCGNDGNWAGRNPPSADSCARPWGVKVRKVQIYITGIILLLCIELSLKVVKWNTFHRHPYPTEQESLSQELKEAEQQQ